jgi:hypothetical protein
LGESLSSKNMTKDNEEDEDYSNNLFNEKELIECFALSAGVVPVIAHNCEVE